jgi:hypothetical protein
MSIHTYIRIYIRIYYVYTYVYTYIYTHIHIYMKNKENLDTCSIWLCNMYIYILMFYIHKLCTSTMQTHAAAKLSVQHVCHASKVELTFFIFWVLQGRGARCRSV